MALLIDTNMLTNNRINRTFLLFILCKFTSCDSLGNRFSDQMKNVLIREYQEDCVWLQISAMHP